MAYLVGMPRAAWRRQPQGMVSIDYNNSLSNGLWAAVHFKPGNPIEVVRGLPFKRVGNPTLVATHDGFSISSKVFGNYFFLNNLRPEIPTTGWLATYSQVLVYSTAITRKRVWRLGNGTPITTALEFSNGWNSSCYYSIHGPTDNTYSSANYPSYEDNKYYKIFAQQGLDEPNGVSINSSPSMGAETRSGNSAVNRTYSTTDIHLITSLTDFPLNGQLGPNPFLVWSRQVRPSEISELFLNPYQIFKPQLVPFISIPAGGIFTLIIQNTLHGHAVESPSLTQAHVLTLADALHSQSAESPLLSQANILALADAAHAHAVDAPTLTQAFVLTLADTSHSHSVDAPTLSAGLTLTPSDGLHSHTTDGLSLTQAHVLTLEDSLHSHTAESIPLGQGFTLVVGDSLHGHASEAPTLTQAFVLSILDAVHAQITDALSLGANVTLVVSDALHAHYAAAAVEAALTPAGRVFIVRGEDRVFLILSEDRTFGVFNEDRSLGVH